MIINEFQILGAFAKVIECAFRIWAREFLM